MNNNNQVTNKPQSIESIATRRRRNKSTADAINLIIRLVLNFPKYIRDISDFQFEHPIGEGGFGQVWLARDLRTGRLCAIKELHSDNLTTRNIQTFAREINTMVKMKERFILPFVGFTIDPPYSIISEYMENGALNNYTDFRYRKYQLSGTHLSIIALGIAWGMINLHRKHIVHRDLKAANILLDSNFLPMICDFGVSRYEPKSGKMTPRLGTVSHMAPELMFTSEYGLSCDVYSYGVLLYEMSQNHKPYKVGSEEIIECVKKGGRPKFTEKSTPKCLINLIERCWDSDVSKRPDFNEIFDILKNGNAYFKKTDKTAVKKFAEDLIQTESEKQKKQVPANTSVDTDAIIQRLQRQYDIVKKKEEEIGDTAEEEAKNEKAKEDEQQDLEGESEGQMVKDILRYAGHQRFGRTLSFVVKNLTDKQFLPFYQLLFPHFKDAEDPQTLVLIIDNFCDLIDRDSSFIDLFEKAHFFTALPLIDDKTLNRSFNFVAKVFVKRPNLVSHSLFRALGSFLLKIPEKALILFSYYALKFNEISDPFKLWDFYILYARAFIENRCGSKYIDILYYLLTKYDDFKKLRLAKIKPILYVFCRSKTREVTRSATCALANLMDLCQNDNCKQLNNEEGKSNEVNDSNDEERTFQTPFNAICRNISEADPELRKPAISVLLRSKKYPESRSFVRILVNALPETASVLLLFASQSSRTAKIVALNPNWMAIDKSIEANNPFVYKLFMYLYAQKELRVILCRNVNLAPFVSHFAFTGDVQTVISLLSILKRMRIDQLFVEELANAKFFRSLYSSVIRLNDSALTTSCNSFVDAIARKGFSPEFQYFIPILMQSLAQKNIHTTESIAVIVTLSCHKFIAQIFKGSSLVSYFKSLRETPAFKKQAVIFLKNVENC